MVTRDTIRKYIEKTGELPYVYSMRVEELIALLNGSKNETMDSLYDVICLAFNFGRAKGYRAGIKAKKADKSAYEKGPCASRELLQGRSRESTTLDTYSIPHFGG